MSEMPHGALKHGLHHASSTTDSTTTLKTAYNYTPFVGGLFSGVAKCSVGHPFDTIKVRLQTSEKSRFKGPLHCLLQTVRNEGVRGLFKGMSPPLVGWMFMDSVMLGSLTVYRHMLNKHVYNRKSIINAPGTTHPQLPVSGHGIAGMMAGWTVSFLSSPIEHVKARLQVQYTAEKSKRLYSGPIDCSQKIVSNHGIQGLYRGLSATLILRTFYFFWWGNYELFTRAMTAHTTLSTPAINFLAGGLSAQVFWITSYPADVVKQRIMTDGLAPMDRRFAHWHDAARAVWRENGWREYWRGFVPCFLRAFPANGMALLVFEGVMRGLS